MTDALKAADEPRVGRRILTCPRCKSPAQQIWGQVHWGDRGVEAFYDEADRDRPKRTSGGRSYPVSSKWKVAHCQGCDQKTLWRDDVNVFPLASAAPAPHSLMAPEIKSLYEEAARVLPLSRRAGAALIRAALEKQVKALDADAPKGSRLDDRIARLSSRVSTPLGELLDIIRHVGNASLHDDGDDDLVLMYLSGNNGADDIAEMLFDAINDLVDELVARPSATRALWEKLPEGVRQTIERKRSSID